jgi:hypothetical protein
MCTQRKSNLKMEKLNELQIPDTLAKYSAA